MKKKIFSALTVVFALCLALTVYALNNKTVVSPNAATKAKTSCCDKKDSCPMKDKQKSAEKASCCDRADCCCKGDSCPLKATDGEKNSEGKKDCCKGSDSCPMKKDADRQTVSVNLKRFTAASHVVN